MIGLEDNIRPVSLSRLAVTQVDSSSIGTVKFFLIVQYLASQVKEQASGCLRAATNLIISREAVLEFSVTHQLHDKL